MVQCLYLFGIQLLISWSISGFKFFLYSVCLNLCPVVQRCIGIILFLIVFYHWLTKFSFRIFLPQHITDYFFLFKSVFLSSRNYNFYILKLISRSLRHSWKICICESMCIFSSCALQYSLRINPSTKPPFKDPLHRIWDLFSQANSP